jgi:hypothetical protein
MGADLSSSQHNLLIFQGNRRLWRHMKMLIWCPPGETRSGRPNADWEARSPGLPHAPRTHGLGLLLFPES